MPGAGLPLVVDLDHTLLRTDLLDECGLDLLTRRPLRLLGCVRALRKGRSAVKAALADAATLDIAQLPVNPDVLSLLRDTTAAGRTLALVSAADQRLVDAVACAVGPDVGGFSLAQGSTADHNLKGDNKAEWLVQRFGAHGFDYAGDAAADLPVWAVSARVVTVGASAHTRRKASQLASADGRDCLHITDLASQRRAALWRLLQPRQWIAEGVLAVVLAACTTVPTAVRLVAAFWLVGLAGRALGGVASAQRLRGTPTPANPVSTGDLGYRTAIIMAAVLSMVALISGAGLLGGAVGVLWMLHAGLCATSPALTGRRVWMARLAGVGRISVCALTGILFGWFYGCTG